MKIKNKCKILSIFLEVFDISNKKYDFFRSVFTHIWIICLAIFVIAFMTACGGDGYTDNIDIKDRNDSIDVVVYPIKKNCCLENTCNI